MRLHQWALASDAWREQHGLKDGERSADSEVAEEVVQGVEAYVMGRRMFGGGDGIEPALERARTAAGDDDVMIAGGANAIQQYLAAGLLDELYLHIAPVVLGAGERLLEGVGDPTLEPIKVVASPAATHVKYRVVR